MIGTICFADDWRLATDDWIYNASMLGPLIGAGAMVAAGAAAYHSMAPWAQGFGASFVGGNPALKQIALTYDDGPNDPHTLQFMYFVGRRKRKENYCSSLWLVIFLHYSQKNGELR